MVPHNIFCLEFFWGNFMLKGTKRLTLYWLFFGLLILFTAINAQAKELELVLENKKSDYPISIHYKFLSDNQVYASGHLNNIKKNEKYFIYVNRVPNDKNILIQIDKITVEHRTVFNDPCEIHLDGLCANIVIGFKGDPKTHGSFQCDAMILK